MTGRETLTISPAECRFSADAATGIISGYAALFDVPVPYYNELVRPGAFAKTIAEHRTAGTPIVMLWSHDSSAPIGKWSVTEDQRGLRAEGQIVKETAKGKEALALISAGVVTGLSIGFRARASERGDKGLRILTDVQLEEVSLTAFPAQPGARVTAVRSQAAAAAFFDAVRRANETLRAT
jgi:uncharacterized protein